MRWRRRAAMSSISASASPNSARRTTSPRRRSRRSGTAITATPPPPASRRCAKPSGGLTPKSEIDKFDSGLEKWPDVAILSDEIYDLKTYDGEKHVCLLGYPEIRDRVILLNGWSKTYAMTGWRLGYAIWPGKLYDLA